MRHSEYNDTAGVTTGFGFSDKPTVPGWRLPRIAEAWGGLMQRLGYTHYVAQGGDWGAGVTSWMARQQPTGLAAIHLNLPILFPPPPAPPGRYTAAEQAAIAQLTKYSSDGSGYASIQGTRPQTLGYGLADSPVRQGMWIYEKFQGWTDNHGNPEDALSIDAMLDDISLYWFTNTAANIRERFEVSDARRRGRHLSGRLLGGPLARVRRLPLKERAALPTPCNVGKISCEAFSGIRVFVDASHRTFLMQESIAGSRPRSAAAA
jgi:pimeloyl-ACP methyl ester carboxylesterase